MGPSFEYSCLFLFFRIRVTAYSRRPAIGVFRSRPRLSAARCTRTFARLAGLLDCLPCIVLPARDSPSQHVAHSFLMFEVGESCLRARLTWTFLLFVRSVFVLYFLVARGSHFCLAACFTLQYPWIGVGICRVKYLAVSWTLHD